MGPIGIPELAIILVIALLVLGPKKLPEVGRSLGKGMREFKDSVSSANPFDDEDEDEKPKKKKRAAVEAGPDAADVPTDATAVEDSAPAEKQHERA